jgi:hypothetical protein
MTVPVKRPRPAKRRLIIITIGILAALLAGAWFRISLTAEYRVLFGSVRSRTDLCRAVPDLAPGRQVRILSRLLRDKAAQVRLGAVTACARVENDQVDDVLEAMLLDPDQPGDVRSKAGDVLLQRKPARPTVVGFIGANAGRKAFRSACPLLAARWIERNLADAGEEQLAGFLSQATDENDPAHEFIQTVIRDHVETFSSLRGAFLRELENTSSFRLQQFLVSCLHAIDGAMRGHSPDDWRDEAISEADRQGFHAVEAEWAAEIKPNYQIGQWDGVRCLTLAEGAGGCIDWMGADQGSVDIASARLSLYAPQDGEYTVWARAYFDDKCGNSFGFYMDQKQFGNFPDYENTLGSWHWLPLHVEPEGPKTVRLKAGFHTVRLKALEDSVFVDKFALLPSGQHPDALPKAAAARWDTGLLSCVSFALERQSQLRGTRQTVVVWIRRNSPKYKDGTVRLSAPEPFKIVSANPTEVRFAKGNLLARTSFVLELPAGAVAGEDLLDAVYADSTGETIRGQMILGAQLDWLSTGPLAPDDPLHAKLDSATTVSDADLKQNWAPYPEKGYAPYRHLDMEMAYGQLMDKYIYLCTDITVSKAGTYSALMTVDDTATVYVDGRLEISQPNLGQGEGRLIVRPVRLQAGRHRILAKIYQSDAADPTGPNARRATYNHCVFKLLLRKARHRHAEEIKGLPWSEN